MPLLEWISGLFKNGQKQQASTEESTVAIGSEAMHDAGLTDDETAAVNTPKKGSSRKDHFIKHNDLLPEEKIAVKQNIKTPI